MKTPDNLYSVTRNCLRDLDGKIQDARDGACSPCEPLAVALVIQQFADSGRCHSLRWRRMREAVDRAVEECHELLENC